MLDDKSKILTGGVVSSPLIPVVGGYGDKILFERRASNSSHLRRIEIKELKLSANEFDIYFKK